MRLDEALKIGREVDTLLAAHNAAAGRAHWSLRDVAQGLAGDVGELNRIAMAHDGLRDLDEVESRLRHEIADCFWSLLMVCDRAGVDLAEVYAEQMQALALRLSSAPSLRSADEARP